MCIYMYKSTYIYFFSYALICLFIYVYTRMYSDRIVYILFIVICSCKYVYDLWHFSPNPNPHSSDRPV